MRPLIRIDRTGLYHGVDRRLARITNRTTFGGRLLIRF
jgi:hypothetical protein